MNRVTLLGKVINDPVLSDLHDSKEKVVNFKLAVNRMYQRSDGSKGNENTPVPCTAYSSGAEVIAEHIKRGMKILIDGTLKNYQIKDSDGNIHHRIKVRIAHFDIINA